MAQCDVLIIGSGPAAWSCALTARQRNLNAIVAAAVSETSWLQRAEQIDNYPGLPNISGKELLRIFRQQAVEAGAQVIDALARQIQPAGSIYMVLCGNDIIEARSVVLAMGAARPKLLPGEEGLLGQGVSWCGTCDGMFFRGKKVAVLSAWRGGIEEAEFLSGLCSQVDYSLMAGHALPDNAPFPLREGTPRELVRADGGIDVITDRGSERYDGVFIFRPAVSPDALLPGLTIDGAFIRVDRRMATNLPRVYACGDCTGQPLQIAKAVGEGNVAAISAAEDLQKGE